jgi:hypothetical protein
LEMYAVRQVMERRVNKIMSAPIGTGKFPAGRVTTRKGPPEYRVALFVIINTLGIERFLENP